MASAKPTELEARSPDFKAFLPLVSSKSIVEPDMRCLLL